MLAWAQNRGEYKKYTEIPLSSGEEKHGYVYAFEYYWMKPEGIKNYPKNKDLDFFVMSICIFLREKWIFYILVNNK